MNKILIKPLIAIAFLSSFAAATSVAATGNDTQQKPSNIVLILADDLAWNQVGYHGAEFYESPNIDSIAEEGMQFSRAYSANSVCSPTRASLMTGKNPARLHITDYIPGSPYPYALLTTPYEVKRLSTDEVTLAEMLKPKGYVTGHYGKWHLGDDYNYTPGRPGDPGSQGFDEVMTAVKPGYDADPTKDPHSTKAITESALEFLDRHQKDPFFLFVGYVAVHRPIMESPELVAKYAAKPNALDPVNNPTIAAMLETMDNGIGSILDRLDKLGIADDTMVIFYSDNGGFEQLSSNYPYRGGKSMVWEGGVRVPLAIRWPGKVKPGTVNDDLVSSDDFFPTLAEMVGYDQLPNDIDGISMLETLTGGESNGRDTLYFHYPHYHHLGFKPGGAIRKGRYKLIEWFEGSIAGAGKPYTLYDIETDLDESDDLSAENPKLVKTMAAELKEWRARVGAGEMDKNPNFDIERAHWRFADYAGGDSK